MSHHTILSTVGPWFFMAWGVMLVLKPNIFVRGIWKETDIAQRLLSPKNYLIYTRCVGIFLILSGLVWLFLQSAAESRHRNPNIGVVSFASNQSMKPTAPDQMIASDLATDPARGLSLSR
jgi:NADH:ubiquinone oxidoreductase subunit 4 (subunit M)